MKSPKDRRKMLQRPHDQVTKEQVEQERVEAREQKARTTQGWEEALEGVKVAECVDG